MGQLGEKGGEKLGEKVVEKTGEKVGESLGEIHKLNLCPSWYSMGPAWYSGAISCTSYSGTGGPAWY